MPGAPAASASASTAIRLATSPAACPPRPSATAKTMPSAMRLSSLWSRTRPTCVADPDRTRSAVPPRTRCSVALTRHRRRRPSRAPTGARRSRRRGRSPAPGRSRGAGGSARRPRFVVGRAPATASSTATARCTSTTGPVGSSHETLRAVHSRPPISTTKAGSTSLPAAAAVARSSRRSAAAYPCGPVCARSRTSTGSPAEPVPRTWRRSAPGGSASHASGTSTVTGGGAGATGPGTARTGMDGAPLGAADVRTEPSRARLTATMGRTPRQGRGDGQGPAPASGCSAHHVRSRSAAASLPIGPSSRRTASRCL